MCVCVCVYMHGHTHVIYISISGRLLLCNRDLEEVSEHIFFNCLLVRLFWDHVRELMACIGFEHLVFIDLVYICDSVSRPWSRVKQLVFLMLLAMARMVLLVVQMRGVLRDECYSHQHLIWPSAWDEHRN